MQNPCRTTQSTTFSLSRTSNGSQGCCSASYLATRQCRTLGRLRGADGCHVTSDAAITRCLAGGTKLVDRCPTSPCRLHLTFALRHQVLVFWMALGAANQRRRLSSRMCDCSRRFGRRIAQWKHRRNSTGARRGRCAPGGCVVGRC